MVLFGMWGVGGGGVVGGWRVVRTCRAGSGTWGCVDRRCVGFFFFFFYVGSVRLGSGVVLCRVMWLGDVPGRCHRRDTASSVVGWPVCADVWYVTFGVLGVCFCAWCVEWGGCVASGALVWPLGVSLSRWLGAVQVAAGAGLSWFGGERYSGFVDVRDGEWPTLRRIVTEMWVQSRFGVVFSQSTWFLVPGVGGEKGSVCAFLGFRLGLVGLCGVFPPCCRSRGLPPPE